MADKITPLDSVLPAPTEPVFHPIDTVLPQEGNSAASVAPDLKGASAPLAEEVSPTARSNTAKDIERQALMQNTTPYYEDHLPNYAGSKVTQWDDGRNTFRADNDDKDVEIDPKTHVVLMDPESRELKVFKRTPETDLSPRYAGLLGLGHLFTEGFQPSSVPFRAARAAAALSPAQQSVADTGNAVGAVKSATGVDVAVPRAAVSPSPLTNLATQISSKLPGGKEPMINAAGRMVDGLGEAADAASRLPTGVAATPAEAGAAARFGINERIKPGGLFADATEKLYDKVDRLATGAKAPLTNTLNAAQDIASRFSATEREGLPASVKGVLGAVTSPDGLTYKAIKDLRRSVGEDIGKAALNPDASTGELKQLYGALSDDLKATLRSQGGERAVKAWEKANSQAEVFARSKERLGKILGTGVGNSDEKVFDILARKASTGSSADAKTLALAKRSMSPSEWKETVSGVVSRLGKNAAGDFDPTKFTRDYNSLSDAGKAHLFGDNARLRKALDGIAHLSGDTFSKAKGLTKPPGETAHLLGLGLVFHKISTVVGVTLANRVIAKMLTKPVTAEMAEKWLKTKNLTQKGEGRSIAALNNASRAIAGEVAKEDPSVDQNQVYEGLTNGQ